jgi:uncharacterized protein
MYKFAIIFFIFLSFTKMFASNAKLDCSRLSISELSVLSTQNQPDALFELGFRYANGLGINKDHETALTLYRRAAELGHAIAEFTLGNYYADGFIMHQNYTEAVKWWRLAAQQDIALAQCKLGICYAQALGVKEDNVEAVKWYRMSAEKGCAKAQLLLGNKYYDGKGIIHSDERAYFWYLLACANGDSNVYRDAYNNREIVVYLLNQEQINRMKKEAQAWLDYR